MENSIHSGLILVCRLVGWLGGCLRGGSVLTPARVFGVVLILKMVGFRTDL